MLTIIGVRFDMQYFRYFLIILIGIVGICMVLSTRGAVTVVGDSSDTLGLEREAYYMLSVNYSTKEVSTYLEDYGYDTRIVENESGLTLYIGDGLGEVASSTQHASHIWSRLFGKEII